MPAKLVGIQVGIQVGIPHETRTEILGEMANGSATQHPAAKEPVSCCEKVDVENPRESESRTANASLCGAKRQAVRPSSLSNVDNARSHSTMVRAMVPLRLLPTPATLGATLGPNRQPVLRPGQLRDQLGSPTVLRTNSMAAHRESSRGQA